MRKLKKTIKDCCLIILFFPIFVQGQVITRLVEAEYSATANVGAYITANFAEIAMRTPLNNLRNISFQEIAFFSVTTEFYAAFLVNATITALQVLLTTVRGLNATTPIFFNRRFLKYQARIIHYEVYLNEVTTRINASQVPTNRGNSAKLTLTVLSELHRVSYELGKMLDYLFVRNAVSLLPI